mmetsp:Transcript_8740/g.19227  ORF Transcript_8740/g.19227 Transcript_8740/m.19227 type:complete len:80 (-) Transcript_8740:544-783(-)
MSTNAGIIASASICLTDAMHASVPSSVIPVTFEAWVGAMTSIELLDACQWQTRRRGCCSAANWGMDLSKKNWMPESNRL